MNEAGTELELRVVSGKHEGARARVPADGSPIRLGSASDNDLILRDAPFSSATLVCEAGEWRLAVADEPAAQLKLGEGARLGPLLVTVCAMGAAWVEAAAIPIGLDRSSPDSAAAAAGSTDAESMPTQSDDSTEVSEQPSPDAAVGTAAGRRPGSRSVALAGGVAAAVIGVGVLSWVVWSPAPSGANTPLSTGSVQASSDAVSAAEVEAIAQAVAKAGYAQRVRVVAAADGRALLAGVLDSDDDQESVLRAASAVSRRLSLSLLSSSEFIAKVRELRDQVPGELEIRPARDGRVVLTGLSDESARIDDAVSWLRKTLPEAAGIEVEALSRADAVARFSRTVRDAGLGEIEIRWDGNRMIAEGNLLASRLAAWERLWLAFSARYGERLRARVALNVQPDPVTAVAAVYVPPPEPAPLALVSEPAKPAPRIVLPPIASVIGGPRGQVMLRDGSLILTGGVINGFRLVAIEDAVLVFEDTRGNEFRVSR